MDVEEAWMADLDDEEEPEPDLEYWEEDDLTPEELTAWQDAVHAAERAGRARGHPVPASPGPGSGAMPDSAVPQQAEGSVPDLIAAVLAAGGEPALMPDAELIESLAGWHAVTARAAARELRATEELLRRRRPRVWDRRADRTETSRTDTGRAETGQAESGREDEDGPEPAMPAVVPSREAAAEVALALTATEYSAQAQVELTADLSRRLPAAFGELDAGRADLHRVKVLAEGTQFLTDDDAGKVDALLAPRLGQWTTGELRDKIRQATINIDPGAAERRSKHAERKARFTLYGNPDQTATAMVERMPAHLGAAVKARVNAIARAAKAAGMTDPMPLLEAKVATGLLLDTLPDIPPPHDDAGPHDPGPAGGGPSGSPRDPGPAGDPWDDGWAVGWFPAPPDSEAGSAKFTPEDTADGQTGKANFTPPAPGGQAKPVNVSPPRPATEATPATPSPGEPVEASQETPAAGTGVHPAGEMSWPRIPAQAGRDGPGCHSLPRWLQPEDPGRTRLTVPWRTLTGIGPEPGELSWIGPITPAQARDLAAAAAADPSCTWRLIVTDDDGRALAITTLRTRRIAIAPTAPTARPPGLVGEVTLTIQETLAAGFAEAGRTRDWIAAAMAPLTAPEANMAPLRELLAKAIPASNIAATEAAARAAADAAADGGCAHTMEASGYRVPDTLRRWLTTRDRTCRNPICRQPALRCDQDHTLAYHRGGRTCCCGLGALCRFHHELKQLPGWQLTQDHGSFTWTTPAGLTYRKDPFCYPI